MSNAHSTLDRSMGTLAQLDTTRGLPRGRGSLPRDEVARRPAPGCCARSRGRRRARLCQRGIADVVVRARVSRQSFYEQFPDKEACFLAAHGGDRADPRAAGAVPRTDRDCNLDPRAPSRSREAYLLLAAAEPEFAHCMLIELPAIGARRAARTAGAHEQIAVLLRGWHASARAAQTGLPEVPAKRYAAAVGAVHDLVYELVATGRASEVPTLEDDCFDAIAALLALRAP